MKTATKEITVVTVDDHHLTREGIKSQINGATGMRVVGEGAVGESVLQLVEKHQPDVLLVDMNMPLTKAQDSQKFRLVPTLKILHRRFPETAIIVISMYVSQSIVQATLARGVQGYLLKSDELTLMLPEAVRAVHRGGIYFSRSLTEGIEDSPYGHDEAKIVTKRQKQIILAIAEDPELSYAGHAANFGITEGALKNRLHEVYKRLGVSNITSCLIECIKRGIIKIGDE